MTKAKIQLGAIIILCLLVISLVLSQRANPDAPLMFNLKRIQEKIFLKLKSSPEKQVDYMSNILESRLQELANEVNSKNYGFVLPAASRYSTLAGQITDLVVGNNLTNKVAAIRSQFLEHQKILNDLYVIYPKNTDNVEYKYIQDDYNYLSLYLDKLK